MTKKLLVNVEKDFCDRRYDVRIHEVRIKHHPNETKYQIEIFAID